MFDRSRALISFRAELSKLINGCKMFEGCTSLRSFHAELPHLKYGSEMFDGCCLLDAASISGIIDSLPIYERGCHWIGFSDVAALSAVHIYKAEKKDGRSYQILE